MVLHLFTLQPSVNMRKLTPKELIGQRGLTYRQLAREISVSVSAIYQIVNGEVKGSTARYALSRALNVYPEELAWPEPDDAPKAA